MKLVIVLRGPDPTINPRTVGNGQKLQTFIWSASHKAYIWQGRELTIDEFNEVVDQVVDHNKEWNFPITVRAIKTDRMAKARAVLAEKRQRELQPA